MRKRVMVAVGFLVGAKVVNICVPVLFKLGVDSLGPVADLTNAVDTVSTFTFAVLIGCKLIVFDSLWFQYMHDMMIMT